MIKITKEMIIGDILNEAPDMAPVLMAAGMHCIGCPSAQMETVEEAAYVHGIEPELLITRVNAFVDAQDKEAKAEVPPERLWLHQRSNTFFHP